ncbi:MAG: hypothetical protein ACREF9_21350, partial [Opitutaceae bacterium]
MQNAINDNSCFLSASQTRRHVELLNSAVDLSTEWELVILNVLGKVGQVEHEPDLGGPTKLDVKFEAVDGFQFAADITTVSD